MRGFLLLLLGITLGQNAAKVSSIEIMGNDVTAEDIIRREIYHDLNAPLDSTVVREDVARLLNLGIFNQVLYRVYPQPDGTVRLVYLVVEAWRYLPTIAPLYSEETGWSLIMGLAIKNFRGQNQFISTNASWGGLEAYGFAFYDPWITGDHLSAQVELRRNQYDHLYFPVQVTDELFSFIFGRYFGDQHKLKIGARLQRKTFRNSETAWFEYWSPVVQYQIDTRDLYSNPHQGYLLELLFEGNYGINGEAVHYSRIVPSFSVYRRITKSEKPWIITGNATVGIFPGKVPEYFQSYFGGSYTIRGWSVPDAQMYRDSHQSYRFGSHYWMSSLELRKNLIPKYIPVPGFEFALDMGLFIDVGAISETMDRLRQQRPMVGLGAGLRIPMTGYDSIRFDYGFAFYDGRYADRSLHLAYGFKF